MTLKRWMVLLCIFSFWMGCGKPARSPQEESKAAETAGDDVALQLVEGIRGESDERWFPDLSQVEDGENPHMRWVAREGERMVIPRTLQLARGPQGIRPFFLVWKGAPWVNAQYESRLYRKGQEEVQGGERHNVTFDERTGYWSVALPEHFSDNPSLFNQEDLHEVVLDLKDDQGQRKLFHVFFKVKGTLPELSVVTKNQVSFTDPWNTWGAQVKSGTWELTWFQVKNHSRRALKLWMMQKGQLDFVVGVNQSNPVSGGERMGPHHANTPWQVKGQLKIQARVLRCGVKPCAEATEANEAKEWAVGSEPLLLQAGEVLKVSIFAAPGESTPDCGFPTPQPRSFQWITGVRHHRQGSIRDGGMRTEYEYGSQTLMDRWDVTGILLKGDLTTQLRLTEVESGTATGEFLDLGEPLGFDDTRMGPYLAGGAPVRCEGIPLVP